MSEDAKELLEKRGGAATAEKVVSKILNRDFSASCPMEAAVIGETEPEKMVEALKTFSHL